ncbi:LVIVD repeat-containing protein [Aquipuribacter sp. MA13-6]|uniref:LVIVD repeat-containing protein n=1 Tax=unclassified Aquipuribacter TaxID=2635084 RepID=UPI003EED9D4F
MSIRRGRTSSGPASRHLARRSVQLATATALVAVALVPVGAQAQENDPRVGLSPGFDDAGEAISGVEKLDQWKKSEGGLFDPANVGSFAFAMSDAAFTGDHMIAGNFGGFQIFDVSDPSDIELRTEVLCPGGQGDPSVYGDLLFISVEETRGRIDCGTQGAPGSVNPDRFRGVRIFDISDLDAPVQVAAVQTCRGSHTHTLVTDPDDDSKVYVYNSGTAGVRPAAELAGCENAGLTQAPVTTGNPTQWRIDVIEVPLDDPASAAVVSQPRIFTDEATGAYNGLQNTLPGTRHPASEVYGPTNYSPLPNTNTCHDVTAFPEVGLLAGACQGNGILVDISDPVNPERIDAVSDPNFSYWHSATFSNDGTKVVFTDEWGGGTGARCRVTDRPEWGANAIFDIVDGEMEFASYYKLPVPQTSSENCVAHNGSIVPVPNRDIMVQAWYQGGMSMFDFTDPTDPQEIAYFDRGPISPTNIVLGGFWSTYWYDGEVLGTEIARGIDSFGLTTSDHMSQNEIDAAREVGQDQFNAQLQSELTADISYAVVGSRLDQNVRAGTLSERDGERVQKFIDRAEQFAAGPQRRAASAQLDAAARQLRNVDGQQLLIADLQELADTLP